MRPKIYVFCNSCDSVNQWHVGLAIAEDGCCLASHVSSHHGWMRHDMGLTSDWKHDSYRAHYPDRFLEPNAGVFIEGYELVFVEENIQEHPGIMAAYALNQKFEEKVEA